jgi:hypothetical protein
MTHDPNVAAMQRYHDRFDSRLYSTMCEFIASNLSAKSHEQDVISLLAAAQNGALELCDDPDHLGAVHLLAVQCGRNFLSVHTADAIWRFLRAFNEEDARLDEFEATAKAILLAYSALDDLKTATAHANGVHSWQGRMAYELLGAINLLAHGAIALLSHDDEAYTHEKVHAGLNRITGALYEGIRGSEAPHLYDFRSVYFPDERDRR